MKQINGLKSSSILPDFIASSATDIDFVYLKNQGISACFFDLDHTILEHGSHEVSDAILSQLTGLDIDVFIATNRRYTDKLTDVSKLINAKGIMHSDTNGISKPRQAYYKKLIGMAGVPSKNIAMIGDRIIQDVWGANRAGVTSVLVSKVGPIKWWDRILIIPDIVLPILFKGRYRNVQAK